MSLLAQVGAGATWTSSALPGVFLDRLERTADGQTLVAGGIHIDSTTAVPGVRRYAALMLDGTATSIDAGESWTRITAGLPRGAVWRILSIDSVLVAATDHGIYTYHLPVVASAGLRWWLALLATAGLFGAAAVALGALPTRLGRTRSRR